uniref:RRM domain-containing protein n=1 Tax=Amphora coffeiformis TaxID=265554 RepID=A0A7S3KZE6_9STRA|mmetsp:Transcript_12596/g.24193  ORF Transcript_12596/g.24193 Transcript_12596/m.24193 type:complete len:455 (+) Transcript_12596:132-1496(+)
MLLCPTRFFRRLIATVLLILASGRISLAWTNLHPKSATTERSSAFFQGRPFYNAVTFSSTKLGVHLDREADILEQIVGGERYEMNELPDSMMATTLFVGNLNEFVKDDDLSDLFQSVSSLQTLPACVVRKPDMSSLEYGFVSFPSVEEKEAAIIRFHGMEFRGRRLKVEAIKDTPGIRRVRIPEKMIAYVSGAKKNVGSTSNTIHKHSLRRVSRDDVDKLSRAQPSKRKGSRSAKPRLSDEERDELERAARKGFVTLSGAGSKRTRPLTQMHRSWCDARGKPQICVHKATGGSRPVDQVAVDLSPLRLYGIFDNAVEAEDHMVRWKSQILTAASANFMQLCGQMDEFDDDEECNIDANSDPMENIAAAVNKFTRESWATKSIGHLPVLSLMFQGERSNAKAMAKALAVLWDIPEKDVFISNEGGKKSSKKGSKSKMEGLRQHRKRGGGHRQAWD